jgi:FtsP/CotA-like multicopper oxidase with cupredoxin domain
MDVQMRRGRALAILLISLAFRHPHSEPSGRHLDPITENDNRTPAGRLQDDTLEIRLAVRMGTWRPEADSGPAIDVAAFAEEGRAPTIPGPLIRVPEGTVIHATVTNALSDSTITVHGLFTRPAASADSLMLRPGESRQLRFAAGAPGTYFYMATLGRHDFDKDEEREQVSGALIIDPVGGSPPDRVLMLNIWGRVIDSTTYGNALTINGRSWPYTERISAAVGDTIHWRIINPTARNHPMHLHGFFYRVDSRGDIAADTVYSPPDRRLVVTEPLRPFTTATMTWSPDRPGNWLYHCHIGFHVLADAKLSPAPATSADRMAHDPRVHMAGLVLGITVAPKPGAAEPVRSPARRLHLFIQEGSRRGRAPRAVGVVLQRGRALPAPDSVEIPGSPLVLTRGVPVDVVVVNHLKEPTALHWHGIELESWSDGVAGWSGSGEHLAPSIEPGDSFVARLTLPRAGTFMYHTHMNDFDQLTSGVYGPIVVLEPGRRFDPATDHVFIAGWDGPQDPPHTIVNGDSLPAPLRLQAGVSHRFRFINIGVANRFRFVLLHDSTIVRWRRIAKDGADLPAAQRTVVPADQWLDVGETADVVVRPARGEYRLVAARDLKEPYYVERVIAR